MQIIIANILRCFFYLGHPFETPLLVQSFLLIISQGFLLSLCLQYRPPRTTSVEDLEEFGDDLAMSNTSRSSETSGPKTSLSHEAKRPFNFWQWEELRSYGVFLGGLIAVMTVLQVLLGKYAW